MLSGRGQAVTLQRSSLVTCARINCCSLQSLCCWSVINMYSHCNGMQPHGPRQFPWLQVVSTVDPFGLYSADIEAGLNDAFAEKAGSGDDLAYGGTPRGGAAAVRPATSISDAKRPATPTAAANGHSGEGGDEAPVNDVMAAAAAQEQGAGPAEVEAALGSALSTALPPISTQGPAFDAIAGGGPAPAASLAAPGSPDSEARAAAIDAILQKDAFLVFRALCKLSIRTADASSGTDLTAIRGKARVALAQRRVARHLSCVCF